MTTRSLQDFRETLDAIRTGTVSTEFAREILAAAEAEIEARSGEFSLRQAVELSGRSRGWFERRLPGYAASGLARKVGSVWLLKAAALPARRDADAGFDPLLSSEEIARRLVA